MQFKTATRFQNHWRLSGDFGAELTLPVKSGLGVIQMAVVGTRRRGDAKVLAPLTRLFARMIDSLDRPVLLCDVRRNGVGGSGSWSPREFATEVPSQLSKKHDYQFMHAPSLAPSIALLDAEPRYQEFSQRFTSELATEALTVAQAYVETLNSLGGVVAFMCAEADEPHFDQLSSQQKQDAYCHRFTLTDRIAGLFRQSHPGVRVERLHLDLVDFHQWSVHASPGDRWLPRVSVL